MARNMCDELFYLVKLDIWSYFYLHFTQSPPWWEPQCNRHDQLLLFSAFVPVITPLFRFVKLLFNRAHAFLVLDLHLDK